uniref:Uncharacterized protein n=1 Tax=Oryza glaberrima TaxID=4538 RepID=I1PXX0_ORYGL
LLPMPQKKERDSSHYKFNSFCCCSRNSGFYTLYYSREFHDGKLQRSLDSGSITALREDLLYQHLTMEGNYAELPSHIARYLE